MKIQTRSKKIATLLFAALLSTSVFAEIPTDGATYNLVVKSSKLFLDASGGGTANQTPIVQSTPHGGSNQQWTVESMGNGEYSLVGLASGRAVEVYQALQTNNATVSLYDFHGGTNQRVTLQNRGGGYYSLVFVHSGKALTVYGNSTAAGTQIVQWNNNGATNSQWKFVKAPTGYVYAGDEGDSATFGQRLDIAYGANGNFHFVNYADDTWTFNNTTFREPASGQYKSGFTKATNTSGPSGYTYCVPEGATFKFVQPTDLAYGANGQYNYITNFTGTVTFNNATFGDPINGVVKSGWFRTVPPAPPASPALTTAKYNQFMSRVTYNGTPITSNSSFQTFLQKQGGDVFVNKLFNKWPSTTCSITSSYSGVAYASGGNTVIGENWWDNNPNSRVAVLMHEYVHHIDSGASTSGFYNEALSDSSKQWDAYPMTSQAEFIASGFEWIVNNQGSNRANIFRKDPAFYLHMVNTFIPNFYTP